MTMKSLLASTLLLGAWLSACSSGGPIIQNPMLDRWCADHPCDWDPTGETKRVGSWHPNDYAVALISDDATVSQANHVVDSTDSSCFSFSMVAKIDQRASAFLELDFLDDGSSEFVQQLPVSDWERRTFLITPPTWFEGVRFIVRKAAPGKVVLAELSAENKPGACHAPPTELLERPDGATCDSDEQCLGSACIQARCSGCGSDGGTCN
jgi:hypothetical protein